MIQRSAYLPMPLPALQHLPSSTDQTLSRFKQQIHYE
jgi:hypothetical protein